MRKLILLFALLIPVLAMNAQEFNLDDILNNLKAGNVSKAKELSDKSIADSKFNQNAKTWFYRAITFHAIYESDDAKVKALDKNALFVAYNSYAKTMQLDAKKDFNSDIIKALKVMASQFVYEGIQFFNGGIYAEALKAFENNISINKLPEINQIDTVIMYNAALSAEKIGNIPLAIDYYSQLIVMRFGGVKMYLDLAILLKKNGKEKEYIQTLLDGIKSYPNDDIAIVSEFINYYLETGKDNDAMIWVEKGLMREPKNPAFHFVMGSLKDQKGDIFSAEKEYLSALEFDPDYTDALFNLGVLYYNNATDLIKKATNKDEQGKAFDLFGKAQPYLEKIHLQTPEDVQILKMLKTIYTLLKQETKLDEVNKKLEKLQE